MGCAVLSVDVAENRLAVVLFVDGRPRARTMFTARDEWSRLAAWLGRWQVCDAYARLRVGRTHLGRALELARCLEDAGHAVGLAATPLRQRSDRPHSSRHPQGGASDP